MAADDADSLRRRTGLVLCSARHVATSARALLISKLPAQHLRHAVSALGGTHRKRLRVAVMVAPTNPKRTSREC